MIILESVPKSSFSCLLCVCYTVGSKVGLLIHRFVSTLFHSPPLISRVSKVLPSRADGNFLGLTNESVMDDPADV